MDQKITILDGKIHLYKRNESEIWQCSSYLEGKNRRVSTKESSLSKAKKVAEEWYFDLRKGDLSQEKRFKDAASQFKAEYELLTEGERNARWVQDHYRRLDQRLIPFFGDMKLSTINAGTLQDYKIGRLKPAEGNKTPSRSTLHHETVTLRLVLKTAARHGWLQHIPDLSQPYKSSRKVVHRGWFSREEYKELYTATRQNAKKNEDNQNARVSAQLHDKVLFMANTGLRPDEANVLQYRDVEIIDDESTGETILLIEVRGKRGFGYCKSTKGAVFPFKRLLERNKPKPTDLVFPHDHKKQFNRILVELGLKFDRDGNRRSMYSLRHSYISFRLLEGADIYQIAKNCRTSVEMIEKHYAVHLKNAIDAGAINVRR